MAKSLARNTSVAVELDSVGICFLLTFFIVRVFGVVLRWMNLWSFWDNLVLLGVEV